MFKRHLVPSLIGGYKQQYCITLIGLLIFIVGSQTVSAQQQIALDTYAILETELLQLPRADRFPLKTHS